jgi:methylmalonyl-CoA/ethylmalonyl-CoA epimerase
MEPDPASKLGQRLAKKGEHVHHICLTTPDLENSMDALRAKGIETVGGLSSDPDMSWQEWGWVSAKSAHGILLEIAKPYSSPDDGKWHPA